MITQDILKESLKYCPESGIFSWVKIGGKGRKVKPGCVSKSKGSNVSYHVIYIDGVLYSAHRLAWMYMTGNFPDEIIDHINGDGLDNRFVNLRAIKKQENHRNMRLFSTNKSGIVGVSWDKVNTKWRATITDIKKHINLGRFDDIFSAACARKSAERKYCYHANHGSNRDHE